MSREKRTTKHLKLFIGYFEICFCLFAFYIYTQMNSLKTKENLWSPAVMMNMNTER